MRSSLALALLATPFLATAASAQECRPAPAVAEALAQEIGPTVNEVPWTLAIQPPLPYESDLPPEVIEDFVIELEAALRRFGSVGNIVERRRVKDIQRELAAFSRADIAKLQEDLSVEGLLLVRGRPAADGVMFSVDGLELNQGARGRSFVTSEDHCLAYQRLALPLSVAGHNLARDARQMLALAHARPSLSTNIELVGHGQPGAERIYEAFLGSIQRLMRAAQSDVEGIRLLEVEPRLRRGKDGAIEVNLYLRPENRGRILVSTILAPGELTLDVPASSPNAATALIPDAARAGRYRARGMATISPDLDPDMALQAAKAQARSLVVASAVSSLSQPSVSPVTSIGEAQRHQAAIAEGLPYDEHWQVPAAGDTVEVMLDARVKPLRNNSGPDIDAWLTETNYGDMEKLHVELRTSEPLHVALIGWFADGKSLRLLPQGDVKTMLLAPGLNRLPQDGQANIHVVRAPGKPAAHEAVIVLASRKPFDADALVLPIAPTLKISMARAEPIEDVFNKLAELDHDELAIKILPYAILEKAS